MVDKLKVAAVLIFTVLALSTSAAIPLEESDADITVTDEEGNAVGGAQVELKAESFESSEFPRSSYTNSQGSLIFNDIVPEDIDPDYPLNYKAIGGKQCYGGSSEEFDIYSQGEDAEVSIELDRYGPFGEYNIKVTDKGTPIEGAEVSLDGADSREMSTDGQGEAEFSELPFGNYEVEVEVRPDHHEETYSQIGGFSIESCGETESEWDSVSQTFEFDIPDVPTDIEASFGWSPSQPNAGEQIQFEDRSSADLEIEEWEWEFGDGSSPSFDQNPEHTFNEEGEYEVKLTVTDEEGDQDSKTRTVTVNEEDEDRGIRADFNWTPANPETGEPVEFEDRSSTGEDNEIESYRWSFHDGSTRSGDSATKTYDEPGVYPVELEVEDDQSNTDTKVHGVEVGDARRCDVRTQGFGVSDNEISRGDEITASLNVVNHGTENQTVKVDFLTEEGERLGSRDNVEVDSGTSRDVEVTSDLDSASNVYAEYTVIGDCDEEGQTESSTVNIEDNPNAGFTVSDRNIDVGEIVEFEADSQDNFDRTEVDYSWEFGDGSSGSGMSTSNAYSSAGFNTVTLTVTGPKGNTAEATQVVAVSPEGDFYPEADIQVTPEEPAVDDTVTLSGSGSSSPQGDIASYDWNPGDSSNESRGEVINHNYDRPGTFYPRLRVEDGSGNTAYATEPVTVRGFGNQCNVDVGNIDYTPYLPENQRADLSLPVENLGDGDLKVDVVFYKDGERFHSDSKVIEDGESRDFETTVESKTEVEVRAEIQVEGDCGVDNFERTVLHDANEEEIEHPGDGLEIVEVNHPESVCRGDSFTTTVTVNNGRADAQTSSLQGSGLGSIVRGPEFDINSGEQLRKSLTFDKVDKIGTNRSFSVSLVSGDGYTGNIDVRDCRGDGDASDITSMEVSPKQIGIGGTVKVSGYLQRNVRTNVDIMLDSETVTTVTSRRDGYYEARIQPTRVGKQQVSAATGSDVKSKTIEVLPSVNMNHLDMPRQVQAGDTFNICGEIESQAKTKVVLEREGDAVDSQFTSNEFCFEAEEHEYGEYDYEVKASARNSFDSISRSVEVLDAGPEIKNFPDQIASLRSGSEMVRVELYNTGEETRTYDLRLQNIPRDWVSQTDKTVVVPPNQHEDVYFYLTPKENGQFSADIEVDAEGENIFREELSLSSRSYSTGKRSFWSRLRMKIPV